MRSRTKRGLSFPFRGGDRAVRRLACFSALAASVAFCAQAQAELLVSRYAVSLGGVRMGEAILHATIDAKRYKVEISADVGTLLNNTRVQGEASGSRTGQKLTPERYKLVMSDGQESSVDFAASAAAGANPKSSLKGVLDPLSALLAASIRPSATSPTPCDKVLTVLMSRAKIDASFHPSQEEQQDPRLVTCRIQFASNQASAVNGQQLKSVQWEVNFQKLNKPQLWLVEQVSLPTDLGTVTINRVETAVSGS
jgi:Protein of unknown function (DUF3108)